MYVGYVCVGRNAHGLDITPVQAYYMYVGGCVSVWYDELYVGVFVWGVGCWVHPVSFSGSGEKLAWGGYDSKYMCRGCKCVWYGSEVCEAVCVWGRDGPLSIIFW